MAKAFKKVKRVKKKAEKKRKPIPLSHKVFSSIVGTLQANSEGEFDLPSILVHYHDKTDPRNRFGLHRESYVPTMSKASFYKPDSERAMDIFRNQASVVLPAIFGEGIKVKQKEFDLPLCEDCEADDD